MNPQANLTIKQVPPEQIYNIRHKILREADPDLSPKFNGDNLPTTAHYGVFDQTGTLIACCTLIENALDARPSRQLRGMAVESHLQGQGVGSQLLKYVETHQPPPPRDLWCNARISAAAFYQAHGWSLVSDPFDIPTVGPHVKMYKQLIDA